MWIICNVGFSCCDFVCVMLAREPAYSMLARQPSCIFFISFWEMYLIKWSSIIIVWGVTWITRFCELRFVFGNMVWCELLKTIKRHSKYKGIFEACRLKNIVKPFWENQSNLSLRKPVPWKTKLLRERWQNTRTPFLAIILVLFIYYIARRKFHHEFYITTGSNGSSTSCSHNSHNYRRFT